MNEIQKQSPVDGLVSRYVYSFGEADGPFTCEHRNGKGTPDCHSRTWNIFNDERVEPRRALMVGTALCKNHEPESYTPGGNSMVALAKVTG